MLRTIFLCALPLLIFNFFSCKKDKLITDSGARVQFSKDSVLFDTVFTSIGSSTRNIRVRNKNKQKIKISSIQLAGGSSSAFKINVDGTPGTSFTDIEIAANDSMYIFIQVNINPGNANSPFIIADSLLFTVNGNQQKLHLEAWGQNAYYHYPNTSLTFSDGTYLPYSRVSESDNTTVTWNNDKPHVIYGYLVVDSTQKLIINAGVRIYLSNKAALWVYRYGELNVLGQKGNEVTFQGVRRETTLAGTLAGVDVDYTKEPGQWDRIWINEGSTNNVIDYAIIKNGYIGVQAELFGNSLSDPRRLKITNTKIQNMSKWGLYSVAFNIYGGNNVISNCQEQSLNLTLGGKYTFIHCTFSNFWNGDTPRQNSAISINNYDPLQTLSLDSAYFGNCIVDGTLANELNFDIKPSATPSLSPQYKFSNCWLKTNISTIDASIYSNVVKGSTSLNYKDVTKYDFTPNNETRVKNFSNADATADANKFPFDIANTPRNTTNVTVGAYETP